MGPKATAKQDGTYELSGDGADAGHDPEATAVMDSTDTEPLTDDQATVVLGQTYRLKISGDEKS